MKIDEHKRINAILFFTCKSPSNKINRLKLMKLLWIADRIHLNRYGRMILKDQYFALPHGPVPSKTKEISEIGIDDVISTLGKYDVVAEDNFDKKYFSVSDLEVMNEVWDTLGTTGCFKLEEFSHQFPEWTRYKEQLKDKSQPFRYPMIMEDFFSPPIEETEYNHDEKMAELSEEEYQSHQKIQEVLS